MCRKVECTGCKKPTWAGCGMHIESALMGIAVDARCPGWETGKHCGASSAPAKEGCAPGEKQESGGCVVC